MNQSILELFRRQPKLHFNSRQIARHLGLHSSQFKELRKILKDLVAQGKIILHPDDRYSNRDELKVVKGRLKIHPNGYGFLTPENKGRSDVFIPVRHIHFAMSGDMVLVESYRGKRDGLFEGHVIQILEHAHQILVGVVKKEGKQFFVHTTDPGYELQIYVPKKSIGAAADGMWVAVRLVQFPGPGIIAIGEVAKILGDEISDESLTEAILMKYKITRAFPPAVLQEILHLDDDIGTSNNLNRQDLTKLPIITIDGVTARDFDDAVCVVRRGSTYILYVSIADVANYVPVGSHLDREAYQRSTSTYLPNECIPMLPEKLSNGLCSLNPFVPRLTLTCEMHFNANAEFILARYYSSVIASHKRATYDEVQAFFDGTGSSSFDDAVKKSLTTMKELADKMIAKAAQRGALGFDLPEATVVYDAHGKIISIDKVARFYSHKLIEVFMVAANVAVAQLFSVHGLPQLYRVHDKPDAVKVQNFMELVQNLRLGHFLKGFEPGRFFAALAGNKYDDFLKTVFLRSLKQAVYDPTNVGHFGLGLADYCHFTSPIRRYPDLIVHRQLKALIGQSTDGIVKLGKKELDELPRLKGQRLPYSFQDLAALGNHCSRRERDAMEAEREVMGMRRALFVKQHLHEKFFGRVTRVAKMGLNIELDPYFAEGFLHISKIDNDYYEYDQRHLRMIGRRTRQVYGIGDRLWVTVAHVKPEASEIELAGVETGNRGRARRARK